MKKTTRQDYEERMLRVLLHIRDNLDRNPGLDELAAVAHFSPYHFHRIFRGMVGESLQSHLRRLRIVGTNPAALLRCPTEEEKMDVKIVQEDEQRVAFVRHTGPYDQCDQAWDRLCTHLGAAGRLGPDCRFIGLCYDDPDITPADKLRYDACVSVDADFQPEGDIGVQVLPGGCFAQTTHFGPYENLSITYSRLLGQWLPASGRRFKQEVIREVYLNDPQTAEPEDLVTDILLPLEEA
ncbi:hypothetical protein CSA17_01140 [bacterium DOLJORAL78_65_58]|nr:MAG: hypothetical protein CSA17_01140 [bacterium DOLJORAL78_65_58]